MRIVIVAVLAVLVAGGARAEAQRGRTEAEARVACPAVLGVGVTTELTFCDILTGREPADGAVIEIPPHVGTATLSFDLHNRHTYSEEAIEAGRGFAAYTAIIGILTLDGKLLKRAGVQSEFRTADDLLDRVGGGAGPGGVKAVAPVGAERVEVTIPAGLNEVAILGETLEIVHRDGRDYFAAPGRPIAILSNATVSYRPRGR